MNNVTGAHSLKGNKIIAQGKRSATLGYEVHPKIQP